MARQRSVGIVESNRYTDIVAAADRMIKAADIQLVRQEQIGDSQVALIVEGDTHEVSRALESASEGVSHDEFRTTLVPNVSSKVLSVFKL